MLLSRCITYSTPYFVICWLATPLGVVQGIYAKYYGLSLATIATVLLIGRLFDAVTDPLIGYWNDRFYERTGTRKPFMLVGGLLFIVAAWFLYVPPADVGYLYFTCWFLVFFLTWTLFEIPHIAWAGELAPGAADKTLIYSARNMAYYAGLLCFYAIPLLPFFESSDITPETLRVSVIIAGILMVPLLIYTLKITPDHHASNRQNAITVLSKSKSSKPYRRQIFLQSWQSVRGNTPFLLFLGAFVMGGIAVGMWYGLIFIFVDVYLGMGDVFAQMFILAFAGGLLVTPIWYKLANRIGKKTCWLLASSLLIGCFIYTSTLTPGDTQFYQLLLLKAVQSLAFSCNATVAPAMLSEICDYGTWKFRREGSGTYFSFYTFANKTALATASALGLAITGWYGFDATATIQTEPGIWGLTLSMTWIPSVFMSAALVFILLLPIDTRRHDIIRRRLNAIRERQKHIKLTLGTEA